MFRAAALIFLLALALGGCGSENRRMLPEQDASALLTTVDEIESAVSDGECEDAATLVGELNRPVNDRDFHVGLLVVFENKAAHDKYQAHERHLKFIEENKPNWKKVRVFDSYGFSAASGKQ